MRTLRWAVGVALLTCAPAAAADPFADKTVVAVVDGFEILARDVPGYTDPSNKAWRLLDPMRRIADAKVELKKAGIKSDPASVRAWRDAKITAHKAKSKALRDVAAHPERAKEIYEATVSSSIPFNVWLNWTENYRAEDRIAAYEKRVTVGRYVIDPSGGYDPSLWMLLDALVQEHKGAARGSAPPMAYPDVLDPADIAILEKVAEAWSEHSMPQMVFQRDAEITDAHRAMMDAMRKSGYLSGIEKDLRQIIQREVLAKLEVKILDPNLADAKNLATKLNPSELTREQLLSPMTIQDAVAALANYNGRLGMAVLTLMKAKSQAVPALIALLKVKDARGRGHALFILRSLEAREALETVRAEKLWSSHDEGTMNGALALVAQMDPASLESIADQIVREFEAQPVYSGLSSSYASPQVGASFRVLAMTRTYAAKNALKKHLSSPKPGVRLEAGKALAEIGDAAGSAYALEFLGQAQGHERLHAFSIIDRVGGDKEVRELDRLAQSLQDPEFALHARAIEYSGIPRELRWTYVKKHLSNTDQRVSGWAFRKVEEGALRDEPEVDLLLKFVAEQEQSMWKSRAKELLTHREHRKRSMRPRP